MKKILRFIVRYSPDTIGRFIIKKFGDKEFYLLDVINDCIVDVPYKTYNAAENAAWNLVTNHGYEKIRICTLSWI